MIFFDREEKGDTVIFTLRKKVANFVALILLFLILCLFPFVLKARGSFLWAALPIYPLLWGACLSRLMLVVDGINTQDAIEFQRTPWPSRAQTPTKIVQKKANEKADVASRIAWSLAFILFPLVIAFVISRFFFGV